MAQAIKEQIKKTSSLFLIVSLILNFTIYGLVFNLNIDQIENSKIGLTKEARAAGNASTTVRIRNSAPTMVLDPVENPISSSTSPINVGGTISFSAPVNAVNDQESNDFWLLICSGGTATVTPGSAPTCIGGGLQLCRSNAASSSQTTSSSTSCTYGNVVDPGAETRSWNAYVCDNHPNQPDCSSANSGTGDSGSPFYINHAPTVLSATTSVNNIDPGAAFTVTATTSDSDSQGGVDDTGIAVCSTNAWSTTTNSCSATTYCTSTISSGVTHSCLSTTSIPHAHISVSYYVFAVDWHSLSTSSSQTSNYTVNDVAPFILAGNVKFNNDAPVPALITLNAKLAGDKVVHATTTVADNNGCADTVSATSTVYESATAGGGNCSPNDNNCYATSTGCVKIAGCSGVTADFVCTFNLKYHAIPTTDGAVNNPYKDHIWTNSTRVFDQVNSAVATNSTETVELQQSAALDITETFIDYGVLVTGTSTGTFNASTTVNNFGNTPIDSDVDGTSMTRSGGGVIPDFDQRFGSSTATYASLTFPLSSTTQKLVALGVPRPVDSTATMKWIYWGIYVPLGLMSGDYGGKNTFTVRVNSSGSGW